MSSAVPGSWVWAIGRRRARRLQPTPQRNWPLPNRRRMSSTHSRDFEILMGERHLGAPAKRAEPPLRVGAGEIIKGHGHYLLRRGFGGTSYRILSSSNPILVTHLADLAIDEVDLEQVFRGADHTDRGMSADIEDFGAVGAVLVGRDVTVVSP